MPHIQTSVPVTAVENDEGLAGKRYAWSRAYRQAPPPCNSTSSPRAAGGCSRSSWSSGKRSLTDTRRVTVKPGRRAVVGTDGMWNTSAMTCPCQSAAAPAISRPAFS
jgi:hypothetical protein